MPIAEKNRSRIGLVSSIGPSLRIRERGKPLLCQSRASAAKTSLTAFRNAD